MGTTKLPTPMSKFITKKAAEDQEFFSHIVDVMKDSDFYDQIESIMRRNGIAAQTAKCIALAKRKLNDRSIDLPGSQQAANTLHSQLKVELQNHKDELRIANLDAQAVAGRNEADPYYCCIPSCNNPVRIAASKCDSCKKNGIVNYRKKQCEDCGKKFKPQKSSKETLCVRCVRKQTNKQNEREENTTMVKKQRPIEEKVMIMEFVNDKVIDGLNINTAVSVWNEERNDDLPASYISEWRRNKKVMKDARKVIAACGKEFMLEVDNTQKRKKEKVLETAVDPVEVSKGVGKETSKESASPKPAINLETIVDFIDKMDSLGDFELLRGCFENRAREMAEKILGKSI